MKFFTRFGAMPAQETIAVILAVTGLLGSPQAATPAGNLLLQNNYMTLRNLS